MNKITLPQNDTYYLIGSRPMNRLVWIDKMGKLYCYDMEEKEFKVDDIGEWKYYERIVLESCTNP